MMLHSSNLSAAFSSCVMVLQIHKVGWFLLLLILQKEVSKSVNKEMAQIHIMLCFMHNLQYLWHTYILVPVCINSDHLLKHYIWVLLILWVFDMPTQLFFFSSIVWCSVTGICWCSGKTTICTKTRTAVLWRRYIHAQDCSQAPGYL